VIDARIGGAWSAFRPTLDAWLRVEEIQPEDLPAAWLAAVAGRAAPSEALVVSTRQLV
jgi:hypothetical protein